MLLVLGDEVCDPRLGRVCHGTAEVFEGHLFAGHRLDHVGTGDEHVRRVLHHEDEVRHRGRVDGAAGARTHDHADLRDHARRAHVAIEDVAVAGERDHAFLDARAAGVVEPDHRRAGRGREVHDLADFLAHHFPERSPEHHEVLAENEDLAPVDRPPTRDDRVGEGPVPVDAEPVRAVPRHPVGFDERTGVDQQVDALARGELPAVVLLLDRLGRRRVQRVVLALDELVDLVLDGCSLRARRLDGGRLLDDLLGRFLLRRQSARILTAAGRTAYFPCESATFEQPARDAMLSAR